MKESAKNIQQSVAVIGAGIGGLAAAIRMARLGLRVDVYERNDHPGGKLSEIRQNGYRFDTGPSLFTLPELVDDLFEKDKDLNFSYSKLDTICNYFYEDGSLLKAYANVDQLVQELSEQTGEPSQHITKFLNHVRQIYQGSADLFLFNAFHKPLRFLAQFKFKNLPGLLKANPLVSMHTANKRFFKSEKLVQLFDRYATYNGSSPFMAPSTLNVISHLEHNIGAYFPDGGMYQIVDSAYQLAKHLGVNFHFETTVQEIITQDCRVSGITVNNRQKTCDFVVSDGDIFQVYKHLLPHVKPPSMIRKPKLSSSAIIFYWGIKHSFPQLELHNILFSGQYEQEFDVLFNKQRISEDPTVYLFISNKMVKTDAPLGCENWFVMVNAPHDSGQHWDAVVQQVRLHVIAKINRLLHTDIERFIESETIRHPVTIFEQTNSTKGALYGNSSNSLLGAFWKHPNFSRPFKNLFFVGGSVHPGGGIPLCLASAKIVEDEVKRLIKK